MIYNFKRNVYQNKVFIFYIPIKNPFANSKAIVENVIKTRRRLNVLFIFIALCYLNIKTHLSVKFIYDENLEISTLDNPCNFPNSLRIICHVSLALVS